jgi:hypothetical protein
LVRNAAACTATTGSIGSLVSGATQRERHPARVQNLAVGDRIEWGREYLTVAALEPNRALVLSYDGHGMEWVWQFGLYPLDRQQTRLVSRGAERTPNTATFWLLMRVMEPASFVHDHQNAAQSEESCRTAVCVWLGEVNRCEGSLNPVYPPEHFAEADGGEDLSLCAPLTRVGFPQLARVVGCYALNLSQEESMRISNVRVLLLSAPIPPERRWTSDFGANTKQDLAIVIVERDDGLTGYGEAKGTPVVMKVLVEDVLGPQLVGEDPT